MGTRFWYVDASRTPVQWSTAVVGGLAVVDIYEVQDVDGPRPPFVTSWAPVGLVVSAAAVAAAQARTSSDAVPLRRPIPAAVSGPGGAGGKIESLPAGSVIAVRKASGVWPARPTARGDIVVQWVGPDPSPSITDSGVVGMRNNVDVRFVTP